MDLIPGEDRFSLSQWSLITIALHLGIGTHEISTFKLTCKLLSLLRSCLGNHIVDSLQV